MSATAGTLDQEVETATHREHDASVASADGGERVHAPSPVDASRARRALRWLEASRPSGYRRLSLYTRVLLINACVLVAATATLAFTPAKIPFPAGVEEAVLLVAGLGVMVFANAALLRVSFQPLRRLVALMGTIDLLRPGQRVPITGGSEVRAVIMGFNSMLDRLETERRDSSRRTLTAQEEERRRISRELHDEIGQRLTGILLQLKRAAALASPEVRPALLEAREEVRSALDEVGRVAWQLRPGVLDDLSLVSALDGLANSVEERSDVKVTRRLDSQIPGLASSAELAIYRVAQESLTNAIRHANARQIELVLQSRPGRVRLQVIDDGNGRAFDEMRGSGIRGMRERALQIGAKLHIDALPGRGVSVVLDVPVRQER
jgi:two-component system sensor histidine kinase UhpB